MSLSFATNSNTLNQWGFSAGDIAVLAGAGRAVGNWLMAQARDRTLLDFLNIDPHDLIARKGLIDRLKLDQRWSKKLVLLQNGRKRIIKPPGGKAVESLDTFTWLMVLVVATLDAAVSLKGLKEAMKDFLTMLFDDHVDGLEYLLHELPRHIEGWLSIATVRNITGRARQEWIHLGEVGVHDPGLIPFQDVGEVSRLLVWIVGSKGQTYETSSSDALSIAVVLQAIGLEMLATDQDVKEHDENRLVIRLSKGPIGETPTKRFWRLRTRTGMRVPLQCMQECVSIWPGVAAENNERRRIFEDGMSASRDISLIPTKPHHETSGHHSLFYKIVLDEKFSRVGRVDGVVQRLAESFFPVITTRIVKGLQSIGEKLRTSNVHKQLNDAALVSHSDVAIQYFIQDTPDLLTNIEADPPLLAELQTFVMGFYYGLLSPLLDISQLSVPEAYGAWSWYDLHMLYMLKDILSQNYLKPPRLLYRHGVMKLLALFFCGAEENQLPLVVHGVVGVLGKLSLLTTSLLGDVDSWEKASKFFLVDVDPSCIPCNSLGIVTSSQRRASLRSMVRDSHSPNTVAECRLGDVDLQGSGIDFTSHIEPDWEHDIQSCRIAFRYKGRLMNHINPLECDYTILEDSPVYPMTEDFLSEDAETASDTPKHPTNMSVLLPPSIHTWTNQFVTGPSTTSEHFDENKPPTLLPTQGCSKARTCYRAWFWRNGYRALPSSSPYAHIPDLKNSQVLCAGDDRHCDLRHAQPGEERQGYLRALRATGRHVILA